MVNSSVAGIGRGQHNGEDKGPGQQDGADSKSMVDCQ